MTMRLPTSEMSISASTDEHELRLLLDQDFRDEVIGLLEELDAERHQRERQPQENRREYPARCEQRFFDDLLRAWIPRVYSEGMRPRVL